MLYGNVMIAFTSRMVRSAWKEERWWDMKNSFIENSILQQNKSLLCIGVKNKKDGEDL